MMTHVCDSLLFQSEQITRNVFYGFFQTLRGHSPGMSFAAFPPSHPTLLAFNLCHVSVCQTRFGRDFIKS